MRAFNESKYVDKDIKPLGKKLSHHSDDGFIDFCTAKVLDDLNKGNKKKLDFYEFWDWAAEVGSKDIVELIYHDFKNDKLAKDSAVCRFYKTYENIKDLSLKDPKKFIKQYGWAYEDKIKDKSLCECKVLAESEDVMKLYKGIVKGRQRQLKTEGTGMWFSSSKTVAKTYSDEVETWELDTSLPLRAARIDCHQKSWNEVNTDAYARKYKDYDIIIFKDIVDVGPLVLKYTKQGDKRTPKEAFKDFTADTIVVNNKTCIKKIQKENFKESEIINPKRKLCKEVEELVNKAIEKTYNDSTKLSLMETGVCIDKFGTKVFMLHGGRNGDGNWNEYLQTLAIFTVELIDMLRVTYGENADVWLVDLKNDCADDVFYPVFGFKVGEDLDETESIEWQEANTWQAETGDEEIPFEYDKCTDDWDAYY